MKQVLKGKYITRQVFSYALAVGLVLSIGLLAGCGAKEDESKRTQSDAVAVQVQKVVQSDISTTTRISGKLSPYQEVNVTVKGGGGRVAQIAVDIGDKVQKGDLLVALEANEIAQQLKQAEATLALVKANGTVQLDNIDAQAKQAEIRYNDAKTNLVRTESLHQEGAVSLQQLELARTSHDAALSAYQAVQLQLGLVKDGTNHSREAVQAQISQAEAAVALARLSLNNATIIAPVTGTIGVRNIELGEIAVPGAPLVSIVNLEKVLVEASISENTISKLKNDQSIEVMVPAASEKAFQGTLTNISPNADPRTKAYLVKVELHNPEGLLKAGMYAEVILHTEVREQVVAVPREAVVNKNGRNVVYVIKEDKAQEIPVEVGINDGKEVEIIKGLHIGEQLVIVGQQSLFNQAPVKLVGGK